MVPTTWMGPGTARGHTPVSPPCLHSPCCGHGQLLSDSSGRTALHAEKQLTENGPASPCQCSGGWGGSASIWARQRPPHMLQATLDHLESFCYLDRVWPFVTAANAFYSATRKSRTHPVKRVLPASKASSRRLMLRQVLPRGSPRLPADDLRQERQVTRPDPTCRRLATQRGRGTRQHSGAGGSEMVRPAPGPGAGSELAAALQTFQVTWEMESYGMKRGSSTQGRS